MLVSFAQNRTQMHLIALVSGKGTDISANQSLVNTAWRKPVTRKIIFALTDVAKEKGEPERIQACWNA